MKPTKQILAGLVAALLFAALPAAAQQGTPPGKVAGVWAEQGKVSGGVSVSNSSAATALPTGGMTAWVCNTGANDAYLAFGASSVVATTQSSWLKAGACGAYDLYAFYSATRSAYIAAITGSSTTTLMVATGTGTPPGGGSSGGGGGGAVTIANGADTAEGSTTDSACGTATGTCTLISLVKYLNTSVNASLPAGTNAIGKTWGNYTAGQLSKQAISISSSGDNTVITRAVGTIKVYFLELSCASALTTIQIKDGTNVLPGTKSSAQFVMEPVSTEPYYTTTGTNNFIINLSSSVTCTGFAMYLDN